MRRGLAALLVVASVARAEEPWSAVVAGGRADVRAGSRFEVVVTSTPESDPARDEERLRPLVIRATRSETTVVGGRAVARRTYDAWAFEPGSWKLAGGSLSLDVRSGLRPGDGPESELPLAPRLPRSGAAWWSAGLAVVLAIALVVRRRTRRPAIAAPGRIVPADDLDGLARQVRTEAGRIIGRNAAALSGEETVAAAPDLGRLLVRLDGARYGPPPPPDEIAALRASAAAAVTSGGPR